MAMRTAFAADDREPSVLALFGALVELLIGEARSSLEQPRLLLSRNDRVRPKAAGGSRPR